jgi:hypothetical protein
MSSPSASRTLERGTVSFWDVSGVISFNWFEFDWLRNFCKRGC